MATFGAVFDRGKDPGDPVGTQEALTTGKEQTGKATRFPATSNGEFADTTHQKNDEGNTHGALAQTTAQKRQQFDTARQQLDYRMALMEFESSILLRRFETMLQKICAVSQDRLKEQELSEQTVEQTPIPNKRLKLTLDAEGLTLDRNDRNPWKTEAKLDRITAKNNWPTEYRFIVRNSMFPDPKHCVFSHQTTANGEIYDSLYKHSMAAKLFTARNPSNDAATIMVTETDERERTRIDLQAASYFFRTELANPHNSITKQAQTTHGRFYDSTRTSAAPKTRTALIEKFHGFTQNKDWFNKTCTLSATLNAECYTVFRRPPPTRDKNITLQAQISTAQYNTYHRPPPTRDKALAAFNCSPRTFGASLRKEHFQAFRRPPPTRDKNGTRAVSIPTARLPYLAYSKPQSE